MTLLVDVRKGKRMKVIAPSQINTLNRRFIICSFLCCFFLLSFLDYIHIAIIMSSKVCKCGGTQIDTDRVLGSVCMKCGEVMEDPCIVNESELTEISGGGIQVIGQWLSNDDIRGSSAGGMMGFNIRESRQITLQKARRGLMDIASNMHMNHHCVDAAFKV